MKWNQKLFVLTLAFGICRAVRKIRRSSNRHLQPLGLLILPGIRRRFPVHRGKRVKQLVSQLRPLQNPLWWTKESGIRKRLRLP